MAVCICKGYVRHVGGAVRLILLIGTDLVPSLLFIILCYIYSFPAVMHLLLFRFVITCYLLVSSNMFDLPAGYSHSEGNSNNCECYCEMCGVLSL